MFIIFFLFCLEVQLDLIIRNELTAVVLGNISSIKKNLSFRTKIPTFIVNENNNNLLIFELKEKSGYVEQQFLTSKMISKISDSSSQSNAKDAKKANEPAKIQFPGHQLTLVVNMEKNTINKPFILHTKLKIFDKTKKKIQSGSKEELVYLLPDAISITTDWNRYFTGADVIHINLDNTFDFASSLAKTSLRLQVKEKNKFNFFLLLQCYLILIFSS